MPKITMITQPGSRLSKQQMPDGSWQPASNVYDAQAETIATTLAEMPELLNNIKSNQALMLGTTIQAPCKVITAAAKASGMEGITRSKDNFELSEEPSLALLDIDFKQCPFHLKEEEVIQALRSVTNHEFGYVMRGSTSSSIKKPDGTPLGSGNGFHIYIEVKNGENTSRILKAAHQRLVLAGHGFVFVTQAGTAQVRSMVDTCVGHPERIIYEADPILLQGYIQHRECKFAEGGAFTITELPKGELIKLEKIESKLMMDAKPRIDGAKKLWSETRGLTEVQANEILNNCNLPEDFEVTNNDNSTFTVGDVWRDPPSYHKKDIRDPIEPEYGKSKAKIYVNRLDDSSIDSIVISSMAHGGDTSYRLKKPVDMLLESVMISSNNDINYPHVKHQDNGKQRNLATRANLEELMKFVGINVRYNVIQKRAIVTGVSSLEGEEENTIIAELKSYCALHDLPKAIVDEQLSAVMNSRAFNPVTHWLKNIKRTNSDDPIKALVDSLAIANKDWAYIVFRRWLIQTVAAADGASSTPNTEALPKFETVLTQYGAQGLNKTAFFRSLLPQELSSYLTDGFMLDVTRPDSIMEGVSNWIVELGELDSTFRRSDLAAIKAYLSKQRDTVRKPYAKSASLMPRQTSYIASVNEEKFLRDTTGNRRYAPLMVIGKLKVPKNFDKTDFWAYVWSLYVSGEQWWFTSEEEKLQQEALKLHENLPLEDMLLDHFNLEAKSVMTYMTGSEILKVISASDNQSNRTILGLLLKKYTVSKIGRKYGMQRNGVFLANDYSHADVKSLSFM